MVYNVKSHKLDQIPLIKGHAADQQNGIHSLKINPSRTLLATGAYNSNEIAIYELPTLNPIVLAEVNNIKKKKKKHTTIIYILFY